MFDALSDLFSSSQMVDNDFIQYTGIYEFFVEAVIEGQLPYQSATINLKCYNSEEKCNYVHAEIKWYRIFEGNRDEIITSDGVWSLNLSPYDIGCQIMASVKSNSQVSRGVAHLTFGPIRLDPALKPYMENRLLTSKGSYNFALLSHDGKNVVNSWTDFSNRIEFSDSKLGVYFGEDNKEFENFQTDIIEKNWLQIRTEQSDPRIALVYFSKHGQQGVSESVLNSDLNELKSKIGMAQMLSFEDDGKSSYLNKGGAGEDVLRPFVEQDVILDAGEQLTMVIRFESRLLRDDFITSIRYMRAKRSIPLTTIINQCDQFLRKVWFPPLKEDRDPELISSTLELDSYR